MPLSPIANPTPGLYPGAGQATLLRANEQQYLFRLQLNPAGKASIAVQLERIKSASYPWGASFHVQFTDANGNASNPGTFELDIQTSDIDSDTQYCTISALTGGLNSSQVGRVELPQFWAKYVRVNVATLTNPVYVSVLVTR